VKDYHINIFYSDEDGGYIADIPDLRFCSAFGKTPQRALEEVLKAKKTWLATAKKLKKDVPPAQYRRSINV
jgi:predicted RNase H-like HicB family nuclease